MYLYIIVILLLVQYSDAFSIHNSIRCKNHLIQYRSTIPQLKHVLHMNAINGNTNVLIKNMQNKDIKLNKLNIKNGLKRTLFIISTFMLTFSRSIKNAMAANNNIKGWDLFGRVPHDDWLFSTYRLTNPNILRQSFTEALTTELPTAMYAFRRRKTIQEVTQSLGSVASIMISVLLVGFVYKRANTINKVRARTKGGYGTSAVSKKHGRKDGKDIDGMEGWADMEDED